MNSYTAVVAGHRGDLRRDDRRAAIADLEALLAQGLAPADLGTPEAYAEALRAELGHPGDPRPRADRVWDSQDPRLIIPRAFGWGWRVNAGALAVRLGWIRPDDADLDVVADIPPGVRNATRAVPYALTAVTTIAALRAVRRGAPVPVHWDLSGRPDRFGSPRWLLAPAAAATGIAIWGSLPVEGEQEVTRPAVAASAASTCALLTTAAALPAPERRRRWLAPAAVLLPTAVELALTVVPIRAALERIHRRLR